MAAAYVRESETSSFRRSGCCLSLVNNLRSAAPDRSIDRISFARNATQSTEAVRPPMSITQSKCMTSLVVRGVDGRTDGRARARTSAKFRSPRDISPSHCATLLPASVDHPLAAGPPSFLPAFLLSLPLSLFRPCFIRGATTSFTRPHCERIRYTFARLHRAAEPRGAAPPSNLFEYAAAAAVILEMVSQRQADRLRLRPRAILLHLSSRLLLLEVVRV